MKNLKSVSVLNVVFELGRILIEEINLVSMVFLYYEKMTNVTYDYNTDLYFVYERIIIKNY